jgi:hypothetical protein
MTTSPFLPSIPDLAPLFTDADYTDEYMAESDLDLRTFIARLMGYRPAWLFLLYRIRAVFVRLLGMRQDAMVLTPMTADEISFTPGDPCQIFTVVRGKEGEYLAMQVDDTHLRAAVIMARETLEKETGGQTNRHHVATIVHYKHWTGPVYFTIIRPFHHLVIRSMIRAAVRP